MFFFLFIIVRYFVIASSCLEDNFLNHLMGHLRFGLIHISFLHYWQEAKIVVILHVCHCGVVSIVTAISSLDHTLETACFIDSVRSTCGHSWFIFRHV
jgi:hypothetical protein